MITRGDILTTNEMIPLELTTETIESMIYEIRGQKVMLDFELAEIYGYETKNFNRQVKNNLFKFPERYRFQLTRQEVDDLVRCKNFTSRIWPSGNVGGRRYLPYAFTEQGIYMLMTVLKGDLATKQSIALIDAFKQMKDYIIESSSLVMNANSYIESKFSSYDRRFEVIEGKIDAVMDNFIDETKYKHFIILDGEKIEADVAYQNIYEMAKSSIIVIDDYIDVKTLQLLKSSKTGIDITIISDNRARNSLNANFIQDSGLTISFKHNNNKFHDRYIVIDYKTDSEMIFHCGASSKDAGSKITAINKVNDVIGYYPSIDEVLSNTTYTIN